MPGMRITLRRRPVVRVRRRDGLGSRHAMSAMVIGRAWSPMPLVAGRSLGAVRLVTRVVRTGTASGRRNRGVGGMGVRAGRPLAVRSVRPVAGMHVARPAGRRVSGMGIGSGRLRPPLRRRSRLLGRAVAAGKGGGDEEEGWNPLHDSAPSSGRTLTTRIIPACMW